MAAGPRDTPPGRDTTADPDLSRRLREPTAIPESRHSQEPLGAPSAGEPLERLEPLESLDGLVTLESVDVLPSMEEGQSFRELRPQRRLRVWQLAPIIALAVGGSLMFAFPLAFESGDAGPVVAMLGLLLCCCAAGWGLMAARRIGQTWPGLPARGSGARPDWRFVAGYSLLIVILAVLAVWRVARLR
ncbi:MULTISPECIES: hypothetical protein [unclassified Streptomyces]|uniref:hypothetical protein n=1 Tax=unclassified Streptomyces TaxID=2593676 RepID=UPI002E2B09F3|nr:hypothetical protein [Streptomyces sp. NBC_00223]